MKIHTAMAAIIGMAFVLSLAMPAMGQTNPVDEYVPPEGVPGNYTDEAANIGGTGAVDFLFVSGYTPWAAMVVNAGDPNGVDMVTLSFDEDTDTLKIELTDSNSTNHATVLVNKAFAEKYIGEEEDLDIKLSDAVNYKGLEEENETEEGAVYVFQVEHFSTQTIELTKKASALPHPGALPVVAIAFLAAVIVGHRKRR